jgi:membrane-bound ClpP family serine protease
MKDARKIMDILRDVPENQNIDLILDTPGGSLTAAEIIINAFRNTKCNIRVFIPYQAMSAGTLISITVANEIYMGKNAYMGPVDPQLSSFSAISISNYASKLSTKQNLSWIGDLICLAGNSAELAITRVEELVEQVYKERSLDSESTLKELVGKHSHDKPLFYSQLTDILPIDTHDGIPKDVLELYHLHTNDGNQIPAYF